MSEILIISLDTPFPDNYGGTKDIWQRLKVLKSSGRHQLYLIATCKDQVRLEVFQNSLEARQLFDKVLIFPTRGFLSLLSFYPVGVASRRLSRSDIKRVSETFNDLHFDAVEIEGLQALLTFESLRPHLKFDRAYVRAFNRESSYQYHQARNERSLPRKLVFYLDSMKFWMFERFGAWRRHVNAIFFISKDELGHPNFKGVMHHFLIPPLSASDSAIVLSNDFARREKLFLYVGNLRLADNQSAARLAFCSLKPFLEQHGWRFAICGLSLDPECLADLRQHPQVDCEFNVSTERLASLYARARIFVCFSENPAGVKLKLLEALQVGLPVVANYAAVAGSQLEDSVIQLEGGSESANRQLRELMESDQRWQEQRLKGYAQWRELNETCSKAYLDLFSFA